MTNITKTKKLNKLRLNSLYQYSLSFFRFFSLYSENCAFIAKHDYAFYRESIIHEKLRVYF